MQNLPPELRGNVPLPLAELDNYCLTNKTIRNEQCPSLYAALLRREYGIRAPQLEGVAADHQIQTIRNLYLGEYQRLARLEELVAMLYANEGGVWWNVVSEYMLRIDMNETDPVRKRFNVDYWGGKGGNILLHLARLIRRGASNLDLAIDMMQRFIPTADPNGFDTSRNHEGPLELLVKKLASPSHLTTRTAESLRTAIRALLDRGAIVWPWLLLQDDDGVPSDVRSWLAERADKETLCGEVAEYLLDQGMPLDEDRELGATVTRIMSICDDTTRERISKAYLNDPALVEHSAGLTVLGDLAFERFGEIEQRFLQFRSAKPLKLLVEPFRNFLFNYLSWTERTHDTPVASTLRKWANEVIVANSTTYPLWLIEVVEAAAMKGLLQREDSAAIVSWILRQILIIRGR